jgi:hypothetical protein
MAGSMSDARYVVVRVWLAGTHEESVGAFGSAAATKQEAAIRSPVTKKA